MLPRVAEIVHHMQKRQYQRANDAYLRLSIGNAPWPIGVTMVGWVPFSISLPNPLKTLPRIHERSAREKISTDQVAHVLNDEVSRKYIQSLKRLAAPNPTLSHDLINLSQALDFLPDQIPPGRRDSAHGLMTLSTTVSLSFPSFLHPFPPLAWGSHGLSF